MSIPRSLLALAALALSCALISCGGANRPAPRPSRPLPAPASPQTYGILPPADCDLTGPPCSAITPEGASRALSEGLRVEGPIPLTLLGNEIQIDASGAALIERFEEVQKGTYCPYWDPYGAVWTRGFGETDWSGNFGGRCISNATAKANLRYLVDTHYLPAVRDLGVTLDHHEVGALASVVWNLGPGILTGSIRYDLQHRAFVAAWGIIVEYVHAGGVTLPGLVARRQAERAYFFTPDPRPQALTHAQRVAITHRITVLHRVLGQYGCTRRQREHKRLGPTCSRWFAEGDRLHHALRVNHL